MRAPFLAHPARVPGAGSAAATRGGSGLVCALGGVRGQPCCQEDRGSSGLKERRRLDNKQVPRVAGTGSKAMWECS